MRLQIGVIGDLPAGLVLAKAWAGAGHEIYGLSLESEEARERADSLLPNAPMLSLHEVAQGADLLVLALPVEDIEPAVTGMAELGFLGPKKVVVHLAPDYGYSILASAGRTGAIPIAMHPLMSFTGTSLDISVLRNSVVAFTAPEVLKPIAQALVIELGAEAIAVEEHQRDSYAEAYEVASNFSSLVVKQAVGILRAAEVERAEELIAPVVRAAVERALASGNYRIDPDDAK
jgi:predicted short-subunit dehydrogenase-like oxidoreductase (DUF2520 family)